MKARRFHAPQGGRAVDDSGRFVPAWLNYILGITDVSKRVSAEIDPLAGGASLGDVIAKVNEMIANQKAAQQMDTET